MVTIIHLEAVKFLHFWLFQVLIVDSVIHQGNLVISE